MKKRRIKQWLTIFRERNSSLFILVIIIVANIVLISLSAFLVSRFVPNSSENTNFLYSLYNTLTMVFDAGCIQSIISSVSGTSLILVLICLGTILLGMITFTGAVIGYVSNIISNFIDSADMGKTKLCLYDHFVILNWNSRASEIINDLLYKQERIKIVVFSPMNKKEIEKEINERLSDTMAASLRNDGVKLKKRLTVIVREGDTFSTKQLNDICISQAKSIIILSDENMGVICKYDVKEKINNAGKGNANTIKTLVQVAQLTADENSADNQQIVVEVNDNWTLSLVERIIALKMKKGKCNIVPVAVNKVLGQILSQFSIMPELNQVYRTLFSNKGAAFYSKHLQICKNDDDFVSRCIDEKGRAAVPLTVMKVEDDVYTGYYMADEEKDYNIILSNKLKDTHFDINTNYKMSRKKIIILGHNSKVASIMDGFKSFCDEWKNAKLDIIVVDDADSLKKYNYYKEYSYVKDYKEADIYAKDTICDVINKTINDGEEDTSILILSDDMVPEEQIDTNALTYLIYVQDIIHSKGEDFDPEKVDIIIEILNPKNYDVVHNYSVNNIVISNRYISKMITQISEKKDLFDFYNDILSYDDENADAYTSKELYIKPVKDFFTKAPQKCNTREFIRGVYYSTPEDNRAVALGYVSPGSEMVLFTKEHLDETVSLTEKDKLIVFTNH